MSWKKIDVVFSLKRPIHIGYLPQGESVIAKTRYYVPGKNFWGAITKRTTEKLFNSPKGKDYFNIGKQIKNNFLFSYFYIFDGTDEYRPLYTTEGLKYGSKRKIDCSQFETIFISSRVSTSVDNNSGTAKDGSLHEIEFIKDKYKNTDNDFKNVAIRGRFYVKENSIFKINDRIINLEIRKEGIFLDGYNLIQHLTIGGEINYGFGLIELKRLTLGDSSDDIIKVSVQEPVQNHVLYKKGLRFKGDIELMVGRGYFDIERDANNKNVNSYKSGVRLTRPKYFISPGSYFDKEQQFKIQWNGIYLSEKDGEK